MIKYYHELSKEEVEQLSGKITYGQLLDDYPQPPWCNYPEATAGTMGCWALMSFGIKDITSCRHCECCDKKG